MLNSKKDSDPEFAVFENPCVSGKPQQEINNRAVSCNSTAYNNCATTHWCHIGAVPQTTVCCPGKGNLITFSCNFCIIKTRLIYLMNCVENRGHIIIYNCNKSFNSSSSKFWCHIGAQFLSSRSDFFLKLIAKITSDPPDAWFRIRFPFETISSFYERDDNQS